MLNELKFLANTEIDTFFYHQTFFGWLSDTIGMKNSKKHQIIVGKQCSLTVQVELIRVTGSFGSVQV